MQLQAAMLVDYAAVRSDQLLYVIGGAPSYWTVESIPQSLNIGLVVVVDLESDAGAVLDFYFEAPDRDRQHVHRLNVVWSGQQAGAMGAPRIASACVSLPVTIEKADRHRIHIADAIDALPLMTLSFGVRDQQENPDQE